MAKTKKKKYILVFDDPECIICNDMEELEEEVKEKLDDYSTEELRIFEVVKEGKIIKSDIKIVF